MAMVSPLEVVAVNEWNVMEESVVTDAAVARILGLNVDCTALDSI